MSLANYSRKQEILLKNFHIVKPEGRYYYFIQSRIDQAGWPP